MTVDEGEEVEEDETCVVLNQDVIMIPRMKILLSYLPRVLGAGLLSLSRSVLVYLAYSLCCRLALGTINELSSMWLTSCSLTLPQRITSESDDECDLYI